MSIKKPFVTYHVQLNPASLEMTVAMKLSGAFAAGDDGKLLLQIPTWVPGDYVFEPYARDIFEVKATNAKGASLEVSREDLSGYIIHSNSEEVNVTYRAACYEPDFGDAMGLVDSDYAILMGTRYLFCPAHLGACSVDYGVLPDGWRIHHPSGADRQGDTNTWVYPTFEVLLDTPVSFGGFELLTREVEGTPFYFVFVDQGIGYEGKVNDFVDQVSLAAAKIHEVFGLFPFEDYTFVLSLNPQADWGLEHLTSNMSSLGPEVFVDDNLYATGVRVCTHELFHAWNVRRLRPAPLGQLRYDLCCGSFTEGLWVAEGFTRYYEFLISTRAQAYTADQFFSAIAGYYQHLSQQPAYHRVSATDSSLATYLNHSKYPGRVNNAIDYYDKGMQIAFGLDARLRMSAGSAKYGSLDEAFRAFYLKFFGDGTIVPPDYVGYTTADVIDFFADVQPGLGPILKQEVEEAGELETPELFERLGFEVKRADTNYLGIYFLDSGAPTIYGVADNSPAGGVGIAPMDVIQTINGFAFSLPGLKWAASQTAPVEVSVLRGHRHLTFTISPAPFSKLDHLVWCGSEEQAEDIRTWLNRADFMPVQGQVYSLDFYDNFHGIESLI